MPIQIIMFEDRIEIRNPGGIWKNQDRSIGKSAAGHAESGNCVGTGSVENNRKSVLWNLDNSQNDAGISLATTGISG